MDTLETYQEPPCSAEEVEHGGGTAPGTATAMAGEGGTSTSELLSKVMSRPKPTPPSHASTGGTPNLGLHHPEGLPLRTGGDAEARTGDLTAPP
jgi:hypothetical protein